MDGPVAALLMVAAGVVAAWVIAQLLAYILATWGPFAYRPERERDDQVDLEPFFGPRWYAAQESATEAAIARLLAEPLPEPGTPLLDRVAAVRATFQTEGGPSW